MVGALIIGLTLGGVIGGLNIPSAWNIPNPMEITTEFNYGNFALLYNTTLTQLARENFTSVSYYLAQFVFLNYPSQLSTEVSNANTEIAQMNTTIPLALTDLNLAQYLVTSGQIANASSNLRLGCSEATAANASFTQFANVTTPQFRNLGVPIEVYSIGSASVGSLINSLIGQCHSLQNEISSLANFTISSQQLSIQTGGYVQINGTLKVGETLVPNDLVTFYLNGTKFSTVRTDVNGSFSINASTPFVYKPVASVWAVASQVQSLLFKGAISNILYFQVIFNQTQIIVNDPPAILPTFSFNVSGTLTTTNGVTLPNAPIKITSFGTNYFLSTDKNGIFVTSLTVPANATDGLYTIYASFAPQGFFGPSVNYTTIEVVHEPLTVTLNQVSTAVAGFGKEVSGTVTTNGTPVSDANVTLITHWGDLFTKTNSRGQFSVRTTVPLSQFLSSSVNATVTPIQAYINSGSSGVSMAIFNPLYVALPILFGSVLIYELRGLGIFRKKSDDASEDHVRETVQSMLSQAAVSQEVSRLVQIYSQALLLAVRKYDLRFLPSSTIREIMAHVNGASHGVGMNEFTSISLTLEDFLYARSFDESRIKDSVEAFGQLEKIWGIS